MSGSLGGVWITGVGVIGPQGNGYASLLDLLLNVVQVTAPRDVREGRATHPQLAAWQQVQISRHAQRPTGSEFIARMTSSFMTLRGDRTGLDDSVAAKSWNSSHGSRGCGIDALKATGGNAYFYCFAAEK